MKPVMVVWPSEKHFTGPILKLGATCMRLPGNIRSMQYDGRMLMLSWKNRRRLIIAIEDDRSFQRHNTRVGISAMDAGMLRYRITPDQVRATLSASTRDFYRYLLFAKGIWLKDAKFLVYMHKNDITVYSYTRPPAIITHDLKMVRIASVFNRRDGKHFLTLTGIRFSAKAFKRLLGGMDTNCG